jgi:hypothetical protein
MSEGVVYIKLQALPGTLIDERTFVASGSLTWA